MYACPAALWLLSQEARGLLARLARVKPFALHTPMVPAAAVSPAAQTAVERYLADGRRELREQVFEFLRWLSGPSGRAATPAEAQRRYAFLRLRFDAVLTHYDIFAEVLMQRGQHQYGVWLSGLDSFAAELISLPGDYYEAPPLVCYLDSGHGAAIRRARTRLPGGGESPIAVVRIPWERMVGGGLASSLAHEVGHQAAALLGLVDSLKLAIRAMSAVAHGARAAWMVWERWISEIVADFWAIAKVGVTATLGLIGVVSLPRAFVFRINVEDLHPFPWIRVKLNCAMGGALYPHRQWGCLARLWESLYPQTHLDAKRKGLIALLEATIPRFIDLIVNHRPRALRGRSLREVMPLAEREPELLARRFDEWQSAPERMRAAAPSVVFAAFGQARADGRLAPEKESSLLSELLTDWALGNSLRTAAACAARPKAAATARRWN